MEFLTMLRACLGHGFFLRGFLSLTFVGGPERVVLVPHSLFSLPPILTLASFSRFFFLPLLPPPLRNMSQTEVIASLFQQAGIEPRVTLLVWSKLEKKNRDFFYSYDVRLQLQDQVAAFNYVVEAQKKLMAEAAGEGGGFGGGETL